MTPGQRPFLPNMSPGQWIDHVECKRYDDISVVQDIEGEIRWWRTRDQTCKLCVTLVQVRDEAER